MADKDYYSILGVNKDASADELKSAYRRLAKKYHPDVYATATEAEKKNAEEKFKEIQHAYDVLSDPQKKAAYDQYGSEDGPMGAGAGGAGFNPFSGFGGDGGGFDFFSDFINNFTGGGRNSRARKNIDGDDIEVAVNLTFKEACFGVKDKEISFMRVEQCQTCHGTGSTNPNGVHVCTKCRGTGVINVQQRSFLGVVTTQRTCDMCGGRGKTVTDKCRDCGGKGTVRRQKTIKINIPAGVDKGQMMTIRGEGCAPSEPGGNNGNLILIFKVAPHSLFVREGNDISYEFPITIMQATLGAKVTIPTLNGTTQIDIPEGTQHGTVLKIKGKGVKDLRKTSYGDMYVHIVIDVPKGLNRKQREAMQEAQAALDKVTYDKIEKFNRKMRDL